jgi:hypothetical protein
MDLCLATETRLVDLSLDYSLACVAFSGYATIGKVARVQTKQTSREQA